MESWRFQMRLLAHLFDNGVNESGTHQWDHYTQIHYMVWESSHARQDTQGHFVNSLKSAHPYAYGLQANKILNGKLRLNIVDLNK